MCSPANTVKSFVIENSLVYMGLLMFGKIQIWLFEKTTTAKNGK